MTPATGGIVFIGGGNMARGLIGGLRARGIAGACIHVAEPVEAVRNALADEFDVSTHATPDSAVAAADTWVFAVKPQVMQPVCLALAERAQDAQPLLISIAAGITSGQMARWLGATGEVPLAIVRAMPNAPALLGAGVTGLYATRAVDAAQRGRAASLLSTAGATVWLDDEALMDAVTAVSGSGPAYLFLLAEAMQAAAVEQGLPADAARTLVLETLLGGARMLLESGESAAGLRRRVTSPGGTTEAAIATFKAGGFARLVADAIAAAHDRGRALSAAND